MITRRTRFLAVLLALLIALLGGTALLQRMGCTVFEPPAALAARVQVLFFGDSHICRGGLERRFARLDSARRGFEGATSAQALARVDQALAYEPRVIVVLLGSNDAFQGREIADFRRDYGRLVARLGAGRRLVLVTAPPCTSELCARLDVQRRLAAINRAIGDIAVAGGHSLADLDRVLSSNPAAMLGDDGIHLSAEGNRQFAALLAPLLETGPGRTD